MAKVQRISSFGVHGDVILVFAVVDGKLVEFNINRQEFETYCDEKEMRYWDTLIYSGSSDEMEEVKEPDSWEKIYSGHEAMLRFLVMYIQAVYDAEEMDIEAVLNNLFSPNKTAI